MMCAKLLRPLKDEAHGRLYRASEKELTRCVAYAHGLRWVLRYQFLMLLVVGTAAQRLLKSSWCPRVFPAAGYWPSRGSIQAGGDISFQVIRQKMNDCAIIMKARGHYGDCTVGGGAPPIRGICLHHVETLRSAR
jgi:hypothetical protein